MALDDKGIKWPKDMNMNPSQKKKQILEKYNSKWRLISQRSKRFAKYEN